MSRNPRLHVKLFVAMVVVTAMATLAFAALLIFVASAHMDDVRDMIRETLLWSAGICAGVVLLSGVLSYFLARSLSAPLVKLTEATRRIAAGDLSQELHAEGSQELATLAESFNAMRHAVRQQVQSLQESDERARQITEHIQQVFWVASPDWRKIYYVSPAYEQIVGRSCASLYENLLSWKDVIHRQDLEKMSAAVAQRIAGDYSNPELPEFRIFRPDREERWMRAMSFPIRDESGRVIRVVGLCEDITDRRHADEHRRQAETRYRKLFNALSEGFALHEIICDAEGRPCDYRFLDVNPAFEKLTGLKKDDLVGRTVLEVMPHTENLWIQQYGKVAFTGESIQFENYSQELGKTYEVIAFSPALGHFGTLFLDVTDRRRAEADRQKLQAQVQHAQKLESLGVLAGGIAHDFNNLLVAILGNADLALAEMSPAAAERANVEEIKKAARRASDLTNQMLAYSGKGQFMVKALDLNELVQEMGHLVEVSISKKAVLRYDLADLLPAVEADANQIRQIVMNLITNASDAIGTRSGIITVRTAVVEVDGQYLEQAYLTEELPHGLYVCLEVADTGCGMDAATKGRLFDPFFTTKFTGRGLGLSAVLGIVRGHRGAIKVYSEPGQGSTFRVLLPTTGLQPAASQDGDKTQAWQGQGTVLVVDDEESVRNVAKMMLTRSGLEVITAADGKEAVEVYRQHAGQIHAVLLDMTMPRMGGEEAFREIRRQDPNAVVVLCSGYGEQDATNRFAGKGLAGFIQKPFELDKLIETIRSAIETRT